MSRIKSTNTQLEQKFFEILDRKNISYIKHPKIFGKPDCQIGENILVFIDSDFWHGWRFSFWKSRLPPKYWVDKIASNIKRDQKKFRKLRKYGYKVIRVWEHQLNNADYFIMKFQTKISNVSSGISKIYTENFRDFK